MTPTPPRARHRLALGVLCASFLMVMLDSTIVYVALPSIQQRLVLPTGAAHWVMSAYLISFGGLLLLGGRLAEQLGRRRMLITGIALFTLASLVAGLATAGEVLVGARIVQGMGAALIAPSALPLLAMTFDVGPARNRALSVWMYVGAFGGTAGLLLGGPIADHLGYRWIFLMNVPVGLVLMALAWLLLPLGRGRPGTRSFDVAGALTGTAAAAVLVQAVAGTPSAGWGCPQTIGLLITGAALLGAFGFIESRAERPLLPLHMLRTRRRLGGIVVLFIAGMAIDGLLFILTFFGQGVLGMSATRYGLTMAVATLASVVGSFAGQTIVLRYGLRTVAATGMALTCAGFVLLTTISINGTLISNYFIGMVIFGLGLGAAFVAAQIAISLGATEPESAAAGGLTDAAFSIGAAVGLAFAATAFAQPDNIIATANHLPRLGADHGLHLTMVVATGFALFGVVAALVLLEPPTRRRKL
ncbi:MFS family permease [Allocatelliglobosispora scoriae]|uniref:MFS family permease n=1 Tax=Allocatelliglobosispora scoriae TaxID=643052 RepID=A0A841BRS0_9ACTN|nr:MFS transporter [Allocatelliglobosispora scoriae]MBB5870086.1 MFS family permease [Allocatelliglobosispora scoriae]